MLHLYKYGLQMHLPEGKLPGYYAQIVKAIAEKTVLFDRDKELLIAETDSDREAMISIMDKYKVSHDFLDLLLLPENAQTDPLFSDYGFESKAGNRYLYAEQVVLYSIERGPSANAYDEEQCNVQLSEHRIAFFSINGAAIFAADSQLIELVQRIAKAYGMIAQLH
ncbi:hypothetical protein [Paenibacillus gansuensis]|uniref:Uncharacterized protein n=1 Tax=Paenibacillus gansuensis TaxID=306542 RepID=A0ABW5PBT7_9BACL